MRTLLKVKTFGFLSVTSFLFFPAGSRSEELDFKKELIDLRFRVQQLEEMKPPAVTLLKNISFHGKMIGNVQSLSSEKDSEGVVSETRGTFLFQPEVSVTPSEKEEFFFKLGFADGNGLANVSPFALSLWATDMENEVSGINGRNRDGLLTAWYKRSFSNSNTGLDLVGGIIDSTEYIGENKFSDDPLTQFMNEALINGAHVFSPSYDLGGALRLTRGALTLSGVAMSVGKNDDGNSFAFYGVQAGVKTRSFLGEGNVRLAGEASNKKFLNVNETDLKARAGWLVSIDQEVGRRWGFWSRLGMQNDAAVINYKNLYSGGIHGRGDLWGRPLDSAGIGEGVLNGGNDGIDRSSVTEGYLRLGLSEAVALTFDGQYLRDSFKKDLRPSVEGWVSGIRLSADF